MNKAYFEYNPVGPSIFATPDENGGMDTTYLSIQDPQSLVEAIGSFVSVKKINRLLCNKAGLPLGANIKQYLVNHYNYTACEILENKE